MGNKSGKPESPTPVEDAEDGSKKSKKKSVKEKKADAAAATPAATPTTAAEAETPAPAQLNRSTYSLSAEGKAPIPTPTDVPPADSPARSPSPPPTATPAPTPAPTKAAGADPRYQAVHKCRLRVDEMHLAFHSLSSAAPALDGSVDEGTIRTFVTENYKKILAIDDGFTKIMIELDGLDVSGEQNLREARKALLSHMENILSDVEIAKKSYGAYR